MRFGITAGSFLDVLDDDGLTFGKEKLMQRRFLLFLTFLLAVTFVPTEALAAVDSFKFKGASAFAAFSTIDPTDNCISTSTFVSATEGRVKEGGGKPQSVSQVFVSIFGFNNCTGVAIRDVFDFETLPAEAFVVDKQLNSATLNTTVEACDFITGACFPVSINLTWTGTGEVVKEKSRFSVDVGKCKQRFDFKGSRRGAVATGSVTALGTNFAPQPSDFAELADVQQGQAAINCE
jgi:hypothetical protein